MYFIGVEFEQGCFEIVLHVVVVVLSMCLGMCFGLFDWICGCG